MFEFYFNQYTEAASTYFALENCFADVAVLFWNLEFFYFLYIRGLHIWQRLAWK
jgi:hypothetical protein